MKQLIISFLLGSMLIVGTISISGCTAVVVGGAAGAGGYWYAKNYRACPYCKKQIRKDASVCPYCQRAVTPIPKDQR
ncbi:MAG: zinc ribbon domain-containing protein [bacterium]|nr:zinc ribbon domain-containing protein [bacterium]